MKKNCVIFPCPVCGKPNPRRNGMQMKTCSHACGSKHRLLTKPETLKWSEERRSKTKLSLKAKWASGTRKPGMAKTLPQDEVCPVCGKPNPPRDGIQSETCSRVCGAKYRFVKMSKKSKQKWVEIGKSNIKKAIAKQTGAHGFGSVAMDNPNHKNAKWFRVRDPQGHVLEVKNLQSWCRKNESLFVRDDIRGGATPLWLRAGNGISGASRGDGCSWYGWTAVCVFDIEGDPLNRVGDEKGIEALKG